ncbi:MAG: type II toxin-antitoxin system VapB family antitoxin [Steroidobacteraceae bacterium]|nr:type II toxin-antitoxin system VapB family antitoxin [Steroidobacteraceae bacterium]
MKTTLDIDDELVTRAKARAARDGTTLTALIEEGLRLRLQRRPGGPRPPPELPVFAGRSGLAPGIDPRSNRSLNDAADGP